MNVLLLDDFIAAALREDLGFGDITTDSIVGVHKHVAGQLLAKEDLVLAGREVFARVFAVLDSRVAVTWQVAEGAEVAQGQVLGEINGPARAILSGERVALNLLQHLSGIATMTRRFVQAVAGTKAVIVDTRKTIPGLRMLEKYAVTVGGGKNHRFDLHDVVLIKDNHIQAAGGLTAAVERVRRTVSPFVRIEVETETLAQVAEAVACGVDVIMLDNMPLDEMRQAVAMINGRALVEASGNVTLERVAEIARTGVDLISSGALTHSARAADISLKLTGTVVPDEG